MNRIDINKQHQKAYNVYSYLLRGMESVHKNESERRQINALEFMRTAIELKTNKIENINPRRRCNNFECPCKN